MRVLKGDELWMRDLGEVGELEEWGEKGDRYTGFPIIKDVRV